MSLWLVPLAPIAYLVSVEIIVFKVLAITFPDGSTLKFVPNLIPSVPTYTPVVPELGVSSKESI